MKLTTLMIPDGTVNNGGLIMVDVKITVNTGGLEKALVKKASDIKGQSQLLARDLVDIAQRWVQREAPRKTGRLKAAGIEKGYTGSGGWVFASKSRVPYMDFVIDGTRPHDIVPKRAQALSWPGGSHPVKRVRHPGTKSNPFVDRAADKMMGDIDKRILNFEKWLEDV